VAARARRLNRLLARAALVPHQGPRPPATMCVLCGAYRDAESIATMVE